VVHFISSKGKTNSATKCERAKLLKLRRNTDEKNLLHETNKQTNKRKKSNVRTHK
jgi:hypothetical protein